MCRVISTLLWRLPDQKAGTAWQSLLAGHVTHTAGGAQSSTDVGAHLVQSIQGAFQRVYI